MIDNLNDDNNIIKEDINNLKKENDNLKQELIKKVEEFKIIKISLDNANDQIKKLKEENIEIKERLKNIENSKNKKKAKRIDENASKKEENGINLINKNEVLEEAFAYENRVKKYIENNDKKERDINGKENIEKNNMETEVNKNDEAKLLISQKEVEEQAKKNEGLQITSPIKPINIENLFTIFLIYEYNKFFFKNSTFLRIQ